MNNKLTEDALWNRIRYFNLDDPTAIFPFSKKLAQEENWSETITWQTIEEYKKFMYLCCISPTGASPSKKVDKVWHLHLTYTVNYWEEFCPHVLQRKLHHHPNLGGKEENARHSKWYQETISLYRKTFSEEPPPTVWENTAVTDSTNAKKTIYFNWVRMKKVLLLISILVLLTGCAGKKGSIIIGCLLSVGLISLVVLIKKNNSGASHQNGGCTSGGCGTGCGSSCGGGCGGGCGGCGG